MNKRRSDAPLANIIAGGISTTGKKMSKVSGAMMHDNPLWHALLLQVFLLKLGKVKIITIG